jgi:DNA-binding transcriptional regulator WhiA
MNDDHKIRYLDSLTEGFMIEYNNYAKKKDGAYVKAMDNIMDLVEGIDGWGEFYHMLLAKDFDLFQKLVDVGLWSKR